MRIDVLAVINLPFQSGFCIGGSDEESPNQGDDWISRIIVKITHHVRMEGAIAKQ